MPITQKIRQHMACGLSTWTGLPPEGFADMPILLCRGDREVQVEGCRAILAYGDDKIRLRMHGSEKVLCIDGTELRMSDFHQRCLTVRGRITGIIWEV